jgi:hypothetical protein
MTIRRIALAYLAASVLAVVAGAVLKDIPLPPSELLYSIVWIVLGPLIALFYAVDDPGMVVAYLIGSALLLPSLVLLTHGRRMVRIAGYFTAMISWLGVGSLILIAAWEPSGFCRL